jgi:hypothetical protein
VPDKTNLLDVLPSPAFLYPHARRDVGVQRVNGCLKFLLSAPWLKAVVVLMDEPLFRLRIRHFLEERV